MKRLLMFALKLCAPCTLLLALCSLLFAQSLIRVPQDQPTIQAGIDAASSADTVLVAEGTYQENIKINKKIVVGSLFIRDGDTSHISKTIIDGSAPSNPDSASVILITKGADSTTTITGFTITGGHGTRTVYDVNYTWTEGGGILLHGGGATISHNIITRNIVSTSHGSNGGGIAMFPTDTVLSYWIIENNIISQNEVFTSAYSIYAAQGGGALLTEQGRFIGNIVRNNRCTGNVNVTGAGVYIGCPDRNWSLVDRSSNVWAANNLIDRNSSSMWGGGIAMYADATGVPRPNVTLVNNIIGGNSAASGAAIHIGSGTYTWMNNTIAQNDSGPYGTISLRAIYLEQNRGSLAFKLLNNIVWNPGANVEFYLVAGASPSGSYNIVRGGLAGTGNIDVDPDLEPHSGYYYLRVGSPARDAGVLSAIVGGVTLNAPANDFRDSTRAGNPDLGAHEYDPLVGVERLTNFGIPERFALEQNYPNPFNPSTEITYRLPFAVHCSLKIYDMLGREVATLVNEKQPAGVYQAEWDARVSSGIYFYRLEALGKNGEIFIQTKKMILLR